MDFLRDIVADALVLFYSWTKDYGLSIILLTVVVRVITLPLTLKQMAATRAMQELAPERKKLEEKYKNDKDKLNKELMELYREKKINPLSGCLPLLVQFPVLIAVFQVLREPQVIAERIADFDPRFLGLINLNDPDVYGVFPGVIPLLAGITTYIQTKQTTAQQAQGGSMSTMTIIMPIMIVVFSISLPAGLPLYWLAGNIFSIAQHHLVGRAKFGQQGEGEPGQ